MKRLLRAFLLLGLLEGTAAAHLDLITPAGRNGNQKLGPCEGRPRGSTTTFAPGTTIAVRWDETIDHPSHYRIAFSESGQASFVDPATKDDKDGGPGILLDGIADKQGGLYCQEVKLPDVACTQCVLQVIQVMYDKGPTFGDNDLYYRCADLVLDPGASAPPAHLTSCAVPVPPDPTPDAGAGASPTPSPDPGKDASPPSGSPTTAQGPESSSCGFAASRRASGGAAVLLLFALTCRLRRRAGSK